MDDDQSGEISYLEFYNTVVTNLSRQNSQFDDMLLKLYISNLEGQEKENAFVNGVDFDLAKKVKAITMALAKGDSKL